MTSFPSRRTFLQSSLALGAAAAAKSEEPPAPNKKPLSSLQNEVGVTTSSLSGHVSPKPARGKIALMDLPRVLRSELDMRVIDLNTNTLASFDAKHLERFRKAAEDAGCLLTNLKMNQRGLDMNSPRKEVRERALAEYRRSIDAAAQLGLRWARPLPLQQRPDMTIHIASYQQLARYAARRGIQMLIENYGWMQSDPHSVVKLIKQVGHNVAACPDTGNWDTNEIRYQALAETFPVAVTCDFKVRRLGPGGEHPLYDLKRCFTIGHKAGFHGPWCLEHAHRDRKTLFRELALLRDMLRKWMREN